VAALGDAVRDGDPDAVLAALTAPGTGLVDVGGADLRDPAVVDERLADLRAEVVALWRDAVLPPARSGDPGRDGAVLAAVARHRVLCAHREGGGRYTPFSAQRWGEHVARWVSADGRGRGGPPWPVGTPLVVGSNDYDAHLFNGDGGVVVATGDGGTTAAFGEPDASRRLHPGRVADVRAAHALTIHKAQGSEFDSVTVVLPPPGSPLLTRELVYTAVTRARSRVRIVGSEAALVEALGRRVQRASGLRPGGAGDHARSSLRQGSQNVDSPT
jgi:exodeoxyribonuclease V alpha subunit